VAGRAREKERNLEWAALVLGHTRGGKENKGGKRKKGKVGGWISTQQGFEKF
jgi:hypothetical protein